MGVSHILIVSGHLNLNHSTINATILDKVVITLPGAGIHRLDRLYPHGNINVSAEQESMLKADVIAWQFPFSQYGLPGLMKQWLDEVSAHGFAHGSTAGLGGKKPLLFSTTGTPQAPYAANGFFGHAVEEYLFPFETTTRLHSLELLAPVYTCDIGYADRDVDRIAQQKARIREHTTRLIAQLKTLMG